MEVDMSPLRNVREDLESGVPAEVIRLAEQLQAECPLPDPAFRGRLGRHLEARAGGVSAPRRVRALIASYATAGSALLLIGAVSAAGAGPLG
jgi:hypothetical protein